MLQARLRNFLFYSVLTLGFFLVTPAIAEEKCAESYVDYESEDSLTREERLKAMDQALYDALNRYDDCLTQSENTSSSSSSSGGGAGSAGGGGSASSSTASSGIEGTETPPEQTAAVSGGLQSESEESEEGATSQQIPQALQNGKVPDDIPPADNDNILQQKVREAAENETDPDKRERLWDEYRKLKGLPEA